MKSIVEVVQNLLKPYIDSNIQTSLANIPVDKKVLLFGDSYMMGTGGNNNYDVELAIESLMGWDVTTYAEGGLGYIRANSSNHKCIDMVNNAIANETNKSIVTDCVLACSVYNDLGRVGQSDFNYNGFLTAITECVNALKNAFPHAKITLIPALWCNKTYNTSYTKVSRWETQVAKNLGLNYSKHSINWLMAYDSDVTSTDNVHPTNNGYQKIAANIASIINGTEPAVYSAVDIVSTNTNDTIVVTINDHLIHMSAIITKESGQSFSSLCTLGSYCRNLSNYPITLHRYDSVNASDDVSTVLMGTNFYLPSSVLVEGKSYIIEADIPIVPYNP